MRTERAIELPVSPDAVWSALTDPELLAEWLADDVELEPIPGGALRTADADEGEREGVVLAVEPGRRLHVRWWPVTAPAEVSDVELVVEPIEVGSRLVVRETALMPIPAGRLVMMAAASSVAACLARR